MPALTTLHLATLVLCAWVLPMCLSAASAVTVNSWCYTEQTYKTISCNDKDSVLAVVRAFAGMGRHPRSNFCQFPSPSADDCLLSQAAKTDFYRRQCNTFNTCTFYVDNPPIESCGAGYGGSMYLLIEYTCQPVGDGAGHHFPIIDACSLDVIPLEAPSVMLYNDNYPTNDRPVDACALTVWSRTPVGFPRNVTHFQVTFRDLAHSEIDNLACPYSLQYGLRGERMCARRGAPYMTVRVPSGSQLQFHTQGFQPLGRFWIQITADIEGGTVIVQHNPPPGTQQSQPAIYPTYPTPTTTKPTRPPTTRPTTPTSRPTTPRPTTPTTAAPKRTWPTVVTQVVAIVDTDSPVTQDVTTRYLPGGSTVQDTSTRGRSGVVVGVSTRGQQEIDAEEEEMTVAPSGEAEVGMGIKIIVGGAVAGAVIVLLVVVCVAICVRRKKKPVKRRPDLGYSVHANIAIANKLHVKAGSLRHPASPIPKQRASTGVTTGPEYMNTAPSTQPPPLPTGGAGGHVGVDHLRSVALRHTSRPTYKNADDRKSQNRKSRQSRKSASQTTLMAGFGESSDSLDIAPKAGDPYAVSGIFAGFPRWADNPRMSGAEDQYDMFTSTLPAQLNKKPMPLPKPQRSQTRSSLSLSPSTSPRTSPTPLSSLSLEQPDFGTTRSTDALYAVPNKKNKRKSKDSVIVENELYVNSRRF